MLVKVWHVSTWSIIVGAVLSLLGALRAIRATSGKSSACECATSKHGELGGVMGGMVDSDGGRGRRGGGGLLRCVDSSNLLQFVSACVRQIVLIVYNIWYICGCTCDYIVGLINQSL